MCQNSQIYRHAKILRVRSCVGLRGLPEKKPCCMCTSQRSVLSIKECHFAILNYVPVFSGMSYLDSHGYACRDCSQSRCNMSLVFTSITSTNFLSTLRGNSFTMLSNGIYKPIDTTNGSNFLQVSMLWNYDRVH